jgi:hypothetical protein
VQEIFNVEITIFLSLACKWICSKRFLQLNVVSSAIIWTIWNSRNSIMFNHNPWLNLKQVWQNIPELPKDLEDPLQGSKLGDGGSLHDTPHKKTTGPLGADVGLTCTKFGWSTV